MMAAHGVWQGLLLLVLALTMCQLGLGQRPQKINVALHALLSNGHYFSSLNRTLFSDFQGRAMITLRRQYRNLFSRFSVSAQVSVLKQDSPNEILQAFCDTSFTSNAVTLFHINNPLSMRAKRMATHKYISQLADYYGLPIISWDADFSPSARPTNSRRLQLAPTLNHQVTAMLDLLKRYNWSDFTLVTTHTSGYYDFVSSLRAKVKESQEQTSYTSTGRKTFKFTILHELFIHDGTNETEIEQRLQKVVHSHTRVFLLHSNRLESKYILDIAMKVGLTTKDYVWIMTSAAISRGRASRAYSGYPYGLFAVDFTHDKWAMTEAVSSTVNLWFATLNKMAGNLTLMSTTDFNTSYSCTTNKKQFWEDGEEVYKRLKTTLVRDKRHLKFDDKGVLERPNLQILNVQRDKEKGKVFKEVGKWNFEGMVMQGITWSAEATSPPKGKPEKYFLKISMWKEDPYVMYRNRSDTTGKCEHNAVDCRVYVRDNENIRLSNVTHKTCCTGLSIDILRIFARELNFEFDLFEVADGQWGAENPTTSEWNGIVGTLRDNTADMGVTSLTVTPERAKVIDFSTPFLETGITIVVSIREGAISPTAFLEPYDYPSWCLILVFSVHATGASIFIFEWLSPYGLDQGKTPLRDHKFSLFRSFWLIWAMLFSAAVSTDTPRGVSSRFLSNLWALFALVFLASYTANLAAFMITKEEYYDLSGIKDWRLTNPFAIKPPFKFATVPNGSTDLNIKKNHDKMYKYMKQFNKPTVQQGIDALKKQQIQAFIYDATVLEYYVGRDDKCKLIVVGDWYATTGYAFGFPRGSPWLEKVDRVLLKMQDTGYRFPVDRVTFMVSDDDLMKALRAMDSQSPKANTPETIFTETLSGNDTGEVEKLHRFWLAGACKKKKQKGVSSHTLGILNFTSAFILLGGGMVLGAILLLTEHLYFRFGRKSLRKWDKCGCCSLVSLSMGKSLTFEQSVMEAIDYHKKHKCKDPICETQLWKVRHELDLALLKVDILQKQLARETGGHGGEGSGIWRYDPEATRQPNGLSRRRAKDRVEPIGSDICTAEPMLHQVEDASPIEETQESCTLAAPPSLNDGDGWGEEVDTPRKSRRLDGKYYFGVEDNIEMESAF